VKANTPAITHLFLSRQLVDSAATRPTLLQGPPESVARDVEPHGAPVRHLELLLLLTPRDRHDLADIFYTRGHNR
jgi:hypothetical protein